MKLLQIIGGALISVLALVIAFHGVDLPGALRAAEQANYFWLAASFALISLSIVIRAMRWQSLFPRPRRLGFGSLFGTLNVGYFVNNILPLRAGELVRAILLGQLEPVSKIEAFSTIVVERIVDTLAVVVLLFAAMPLVHFSGGATKPAVILGGIMVILLAALLMAALHRDTAVRLVRGTARMFPERFRAPLADRAESALNGLGALTDPRSAAEVVGLTAIVYLLGVAAMEAQLRAFHLQLPPAAPFFLLAAGTLGLVVPAPAGIGVWEGILIAVLTGLFGIDRTQAASLAVVSHVIFFLPPMLFAALFLWRLGTSWSALLGLTRSQASDETLGEPRPLLD